MNTSTRSFILTTILLLTIASGSPAETPDLGGGSTFGSGAYGSWVTDTNGLPAYEPMMTGTRFVTTNYSDPLHMLGNKQTTAFASPDGPVQLFTNRTFPRFANAYMPDKKAYGGGFGYVQQATRSFGTAGPDLPAGSTVKVTLGMGYVERAIVSGDLKIVQRTYLAKSDEAVIDEVAITNLGKASQQLNYLPYWDVNWQMSTAVGLVADGSKVIGAYDSSRRTVKLVSQATRGNMNVPSKIVDPSPKVAYLTALSHPLESFETDQAAFFGSGMRSNPAEAMRRASLPNRLPTVFNQSRNDATVLVGRFNVTLAPAQTTTIYTAYGITEVGTENAAIDRLRSGYAVRRAEQAQELLREIPRLKLPQERWLEREAAWNYYHLRAGLIQEDFWQPGNGLRILNQGSVYLYQLGGNMTLRDPLQHVMPLLGIQPDLAKDTLLYVLKNVQADGKIPYGTAGYGAPDETLLQFQPSDLALWLLWTASEYVFATRDFAFLQLPVKSVSDPKGTTVAALLKRAYLYQVNKIGYGSHGLIRIQNSDWNDIIVKGSSNKSATIANGESTVNTAIAAYVYKRYQQMISSSDPVLALQVAAERFKVVNVLRQQWKGQFFNRGYVAMNENGTMSEVGNEALWLEANSFALLSDDALTPAQTDAMVTALKTRLSDQSATGMSLVSTGMYPQFKSETTQGTWNSINGAAIQGLLKRSNEIPRAADLAFTEFKKNSLAYHAETFRNIWYGIWSGPDSYYNEMHRDDIPAPFLPGTSWMDGRNIITQNMHFPTANMHAHAPMLQSAIRFSGIEPTYEGFTINPKFPYSDFTWTTPVQSVEYSAQRASGSLTVANQNSVVLTVTLPAGLEGKSSVSVTVNQSVANVPVSGKTVRFSAKPDSTRTVRWLIQ